MHPRPAAQLRAAAGAALLALALAAGCGSDASTGDEPVTVAEAERSGGVVDVSGTEAVGEMTAGSVASLVECRDWNGANQKQKLATIEDVRSQQNREDPGITEPELTDQEAEDLFNHACEPAYAQGFRLYKLYAHADGFIELKREIDG